MSSQFIILLMISFVIFTIYTYNIVFGSLDSFDNTAPSIQIIDPISGSTISKNNIIVNGTSYDVKSGIQAVEVFAHPYPYNDKKKYELATPLSPGNWSKWSIPISFDTQGVYRILARAQDNSDNQKWFESIIHVPFLVNKKIHLSNVYYANDDSQINKTNIAFVDPTFTSAAYSPNAFYDFYNKYENMPKEKNVTTDLDMLTAPVVDPLWIDPYSSSESAKNLFEFSSIEPHNNHIILFREYLKDTLSNITLTTIKDQDIHNGHIFDQNRNNVYDILILFHDEYATASMYYNYKQFVSNGGIIIFLDANVFYAEVDYNKEKNEITLVKGHDWEFNGKVAKKSVAERWFYDNQKWIGSNFLESQINDNINYKNNPFNYTHFEENYVSNPMSRIILDYQIELPKSTSYSDNTTVATYDLHFGKGKVIMIGLYGERLVNNTKFLKFFEKIVSDSVFNINSSKENKLSILNNTSTAIKKHNFTKSLDKFGISKIYPTKVNGREWYVDMNNPDDGPLVHIDEKLTKRSDNSWRVSGKPNAEQVRIEIGTLEGQEEWKNVEITGYARVVKTTGHEPNSISDLDNVFQWYARGGKHNEEVPCEGSSLKGRLSLNGDASWIKEIWHTGGYTNEQAKTHVTSPLVSKSNFEGRFYDGIWFGFKVIMFNIENDKFVKMESYLDGTLNNNWTQTTSLTDQGNWYSNNPDFYEIDCNKPKNYIVTNSGPIVGFRTDNVIWDFKYLSVREISPPN